MKLEPKSLVGRFVQLEPFVPELKSEVRAAVDCDADTWVIMATNANGDSFESYWSAACGAPTSHSVPYAIRRHSDERVVGMSTFYTIRASQGEVEIGTTFLHPEARAGYVNPESKLLMLDHAFASGAVRVQFNIDIRNQRSQAAVAKLGAVREGVLRQNRVTWTGHIRDTVVFSILDHEWPSLKQGLEKRLAAFDD
jgi:RimJ/RimL family protein N-acetyltransferase